MATDPHARATELGYETQDANPRGLLIFFICMGVFLVLMGIVVAWLFGHFAKTDIPKPFTSAPFEYVRPLPPAPQLQAAPTVDIQDYLQSQQKLLNSYGWVDQQQGVVRIPIDEAMDLVSQKGFPVRDQQSTATQTPASPSTAAHPRSGTAQRNTSQNPEQHEVQP